MLRCVELAKRGVGMVAPNPMVGAVLVYDNQIIGEGWHAQYGQAHAEVNCLNSVKGRHANVFGEATLYVSLEPCAHFGKTPPCTNLIIEKGIKKVVIGCVDSYKEVAGKGIERLQQAGIEVIVGVEEKKCSALNKRFFTYHQYQRPYIILKWAQTADQKIAFHSSDRLLISNKTTNQLVHSWRSAEQAILVGAKTAINDNPSLTVRLVKGNNPVRLLIDTRLRTPNTHLLFADTHKTIVYNYHKQHDDGVKSYVQVNSKSSVITQLLADCYSRGIQSILVEGGAFTIQQFIDSGFWDEARVIENKLLQVGDGVPAPILSNHALVDTQQISSNILRFYFPNVNSEL